VHKDAEKHLVQMEERYRGLLEAAPDGMVVVNQGGEIVLLNVQAEKHFGYRRDELLGQKVTNIIPEGFAERLIADGTRTAAEALAQQIGTGIELYGLRKDGSEFPIEIMLSPLESAEGILVTAAIRDITVQKEREHHIKAQNWALRAYADAALALAPTHDSQELLQAVCNAIVRESIYVLAWIGIAEDGLDKPIRVAASAGSAVSFLHGLHLSWRMVRQEKVQRVSAFAPANCKIYPIRRHPRSLRPGGSVQRKAAFAPACAFRFVSKAVGAVCWGSMQRPPTRLNRLRSRYFNILRSKSFTVSTR
jgi:PAS domain S-box-containing protein